MQPDAKHPLQFETDIPYTQHDKSEQSLDLLRPAHSDGHKRPLIVYLHDGAWQKGDKRDGGQELASLVRNQQYVVASVNYRLTQHAKWPDQLHDCKAAIRWLRAHADRYGIDANRVAVWGKSAGAYLALMLGATGTKPALNGVVGQYHNYSVKVSAVINYSGVVDLSTLPHQASKIDHDGAHSPEGRLIGGTLSQFIYSAKDASPLEYLSNKMPPVLTVHSVEDEIIPYAQAEQLHQQLNALNITNTLVPLHGAKHGDFPAEAFTQVTNFLAEQFKS